MLSCGVSFSNHTSKPTLPFIIQILIYLLVATTGLFIARTRLVFRFHFMNLLPLGFPWSFHVCFSLGDAFIIVVCSNSLTIFFEASNCEFWKNMEYPESNLNFHHIIHHPLDEPRCYMWAMCIWNEPPSFATMAYCTTPFLALHLGDHKLLHFSWIFFIW